MVQQKFHQYDIAGLRRSQERRRAVFVEPLIGEYCPRFRTVLDASVNVGALVEQQLDEFEMIEIALANRIIAGFNVSIIGGQIQWDPAAFVGKIRIGAVIEQECSNLVITILSGNQQRAPAVSSDLIDIG